MSLNLLIKLLCSSFYVIHHKKSLILRKPDFCICKNKGADQMCSNCTADQCFCFCCMDSIVPFLLEYKILSFVFDCTQFVSDLVGKYTHKRFSYMVIRMSFAICA